MDTSNLTEWEKQKEKEEFHKMYEEQMKKIAAIRKDTTSKFVSTAILNENNQEKEILKTSEIEQDKQFVDEEEHKDYHQAAKEKKFGKLTRTQFEWRPHPTVCKRFNVPNPFPDNKEYGTVKNEPEKRKTRDKYSIFDVMTAVTRFDKEKSSTFLKTCIFHL